MTMTADTKVSFKLKDTKGADGQVVPGAAGTGTTCSDEHAGKVLVAIDTLGGVEQELHQVIRCNVTWLTVVAK